MNEKLEQQLQADFPFMATNKADGEENLYRRYGCDCDDGWYGLIHEMCQSIARRYAEDGLAVDLIPLQLKEKYATLRFYYTFDGAPSGSAAIDLPGGQSVRLEPDAGAPRDERRELLWRDVAQIIRVYEAKSGSVCEKCGSTDGASIRKDLGWWRTLCKDCYAKRLAQKARKNT